MILTGQSLVDKAREIAEKAHAGQFRADRVTPYLNHPLDVAKRFIALWNAQGDYYTQKYAEDRWRGEALAIAHDIVEDSDWTIEQLSIAGLESIEPELRLLTNDDGLTYLNYLLRLKSSGNLLALMVKFCDMDSNESDLANIPSAGRRKAMATKYELARFILTC